MTDRYDPRYQRQISLPEFGEAGQARLAEGRVLIVGVGGLGSPAAMYLAAAGVGTLGLVDFDAVDETNLHRQIIYGTPDVGRPKLDAAAERLHAINPGTALELHDAPLDATNARRLIERYRVVIDGTDNFATRYLVNDACVMTKTPNVYGSIHRFEGQASVFAAADGPCYRCLHPDPPPAGLIPSCAEAGVLGVLPGIIGTLQATEAIKLLTGIGEPLVGRLVLYDALRLRFRQIALPRDPDCPVCGERPTIRELVAYDRGCATDPRSEDLSAEQLRNWRETGKAHILLDVREPFEHARSRIEGAVLIPLGSLEERLGEIPWNLPVVAHCQSGGRSARAAEILRRHGFQAHNLIGGIRAWNSRV
jgi:adenylyltransferase/sulfurtransferase